MKPVSPLTWLVVTVMAALWLPVLVMMPGCTHKVEVAVTELPPIHMTLDVNIRVQRELDDLLAFQAAPPTATSPTPPTPTTNP